MFEGYKSTDIPKKQTKTAVIFDRIAAVFLLMLILFS